MENYDYDDAEFEEQDIEFDNDIKLNSIETQVKIATDFVKFVQSQLDMKHTLFKCKLYNEKVINLSLGEIQEVQIELEKYHRKDDIIKNYETIVETMPNIVFGLSDRIAHEFSKLITLLEAMEQERKEYYDENDTINSDIKMLEEKNKNITKIKDEEIRLLQKRLDEAELQLKHELLQQGKQLSSNVFDDNVAQNIAVENDNFEEFETPKLTKKEKIQLCHEEVLRNLKDEGYYPMHKTNPIVAKVKYLNIWGFVCIKEDYDLSSKDAPQFIHHIGDYIDEPDNYFDNISEVEKRKLENV